MNIYYFVKATLTFLLILTIGPLSAQLQTGEFAIGGIKDEIASSIVQSSDGGYVMVGATASYGDTMAFNTDVYVVKLNSLGTIQWTKTIGGIGIDGGYSVIQTKDKGYFITGYTNSYGAGGYDVYVIKMDSLGNLSWTKTIGGKKDDYGYSAVQSKDGGFVIAGYTYSYGDTDLAFHNDDIYVLKIDSLGNLLWNYTYGAIGNDEGYSITQTKDGGFAITGQTNSFNGDFALYVVKIDSIGKLLWAETYGGNTIYSNTGESIIATRDGGLAIAGTTNEWGAGSNDCYILKLTSTGIPQWYKTVGGLNLDIAFSIYQAKDDGFAIAGITTSFGFGSRDAYIFKLDSLGNLKWTRTYGGANDDNLNSIIQTKDHGYAAAGYTFSYGNGSTDIFFLKIDSVGDICASYSGGGNLGGGVTSTVAPSLKDSGGIEGLGGVIGSGGILTNNCSTLTFAPTIENPNNNGSLSNAYPNPTSHSTTIKYELPEGANQGQLIFYDLQGKEVKSFTVDRTFNDIIVTTTDLAAGTYLYILKTSNGFIGSKKMVVIK